MRSILTGTLLGALSATILQTPVHAQIAPATNPTTTSSSAELIVQVDEAFITDEFEVMAGQQCYALNGQRLLVVKIANRGELSFSIKAIKVANEDGKIVNQEKVGISIGPMRASTTSPLDRTVRQSLVSQDGSTKIPISPKQLVYVAGVDREFGKELFLVLPDSDKKIKFQFSTR